jgi:hypothetical protein
MELEPSTVSAYAAVVALVLSYFSFKCTEKAQKQNVNIQLLKERYDVYLLLKKWCDFTSRLIEECDMNYIEMFYAWGDAELMRLANDFCEQQRKLLKDPKNKDIKDLQPIYVFMKSYFQKILCEEQCRINTAKYLYGGDVFSNIEKFTNEFFKIVKNISIEKELHKDGISRLKNALEELREDEVLDEMTKQISSLRDLL